MRLTDRQRHDRDRFAEFVAKRITPHADRWDDEERLPPEFVAEFAGQGYLGALVPARYGGAEFDAVTFGLLNEAVGYGCSSARSLLTVHSMVVHAITRWGSAAQRSHWLPRLATGEAVGAFALTEPGSGSDAAGLATTARLGPDGYVLDGTKRWITYGQRADVFLLFARYDDRLTAFLVERAAPGLSVVPVGGLLGTRASMVAELRLSGCVVPADAVVGRPGFGLAAVATSALDIGRYSVACGCVGLLAACLDAALDHAEHRVQFGKPLREHQLVQRLLADMATRLRAARLLCHEAGELKDAGDPETVAATWMAKYFASTGAFASAADTVQIFGAAGCGQGHPAQRLLRDAKIMEIIEGSSELQQIHIGQSAYQNRGREWTPARP
jgi:alkylation response protein AidB-like acyl-CoA dehydrogenase